jgi:hypothetical protein
MLLAYHDRQFVELAYRLFLNRESDPEGLRHYVGRLRNGVSRREIAYLIGTSAEAKSKGTDQRLFAAYKTWRKVERIPVIGTFLLIVICMVRFKHIVSELRRLQNAVFGGPETTNLPVSK